MFVCVGFAVYQCSEIVKMKRERERDKEGGRERCKIDKVRGSITKITNRQKVNDSTEKSLKETMK